MVCKHKYLSHQSILNVVCPNGASYHWRVIINAKYEIKLASNSDWAMGNLLSGLIIWVVFGPKCLEVPFVYIGGTDMRLNVIIMDGNWCVDNLCSMLPMNFVVDLNFIERTRLLMYNDHYSKGFIHGIPCKFLRI